jgi:putative methionine-R-sulfoxide reductase with GAF domain
VGVGKLVRGAREALGIWADIASVAISVAAIAGVAIWLRKQSVPAWLFVAVIGLALAVCLVAFLLGRRSVPGSEEASRLRLELRQADDDLTTMSQYQRVVADTLAELRRVFGMASPEDSLQRLASLRSLVVNAVVQGVSSARTERIRCAFFTPRTINGEVRLCIKYHQGHTATGEEHVRLFPDGRSIAGAAFVSREPVYVSDAMNDARFQTNEGGRVIGTLYCVPVFGYRVGGEPIGVFSVASNQTQAFDTAFDKEFVAVCANIFSLLESVASAYEGIADVDDGDQAQRSLDRGNPSPSAQPDNVSEPPDRRTE